MYTQHYHLHSLCVAIPPTSSEPYICNTCGQYTWTFIILFLDKIYMILAFITLISTYNLSNRLTWHNVQWKWFIWSPVPICACNCGSIAWSNCTKAQGGYQATLVSVIAHNFCSKVILQYGGCTRVVHGLLSKPFISPENSSSLSSKCEGDFIWGTSVSSRDTASQTDLI